MVTNLTHDMYGSSRDDVLNGAAGADRIVGGAGNDTMDGGAGSDFLNGGSGNDLLVYNLSANSAAGTADTYMGGSGKDTLWLQFTRAEWLTHQVQTQLAAYLTHLGAVTNPTTGEVSNGAASDFVFTFGASTLTVQMVESVRVSVDGVELTPANDPVTAVGDAGATLEDGPAVDIRVLANDTVPDLVATLALATGPAHGTATLQQPNPDDPSTWYFHYQANSPDFQYLAQGQTTTDSFTYLVTDADGSTGTATVTVTITGTNDAPVVTNTSQALLGAVQEDRQLTAGGQLGASDVDQGATQTWSVQGSPAGTYGSIAVDASGKWTYTLDNAAHQDLAQGESHDENFTIRVTDDQGAFVDQAVKVTVAGTNDAPVITAGATTGSVTEDAAAKEVTGHLTAVDPDHGAHDTWSAQGGVPSGSADFHFAMDSLTITRNGSTWFQDNFSDGMPPPVGPNGTSTAYIAFASPHLTETGGRLVFDGANAVPFVGVGSPDPIVGEDVLVRSNLDPANTTDGLKSNMDFTVTGVFDLLLPDRPRESFGIRFSDRVVGGNGTPPDQLGDNVVELRIGEGTDGIVRAILRKTDFVHDTVTNLQTIVLNAPAGADQIRLNLSHEAANQGVVHGWFDYLQGGTVVGTQAFSATGLIFQGENWTRVETLAAAPATNDAVLGGTYGSLVIDQSGKWTYDLDNSKAATQALAAGQHGTDTFNVKVQDEFGASDTRTISVDVTGSNDAPVLQTNAVVSRTLAEDNNVSGGKLTASGDTQFADLDLTDTHVVSTALASAQLSGGGALPADLAAALPGALTATLIDEATGDAQGGYHWDFAIDNAATQSLGAGQSLALTYNVAVTDNNGASTTQQVNITVTGTNDAPVVATVDAGGAVTEMGTPSGNLTDSGSIAFSDVDLTDVHGISAVTPSSGALGTLTASVSTDTTGSGTGGVVTWHYSVPASAVEYLGAGQTKLENFTFNVLDGHGGSVARTVGVTITGTNDAPVAVDDTNAITAAAISNTAHSSFVNWTDWTSAAAGKVNGTIDLGNGQTIGVTYTGEYAFTQTNGGTFYYTDGGGTYTSAAVANGPGSSDIIALSQATQKTLTFSQPVDNLFFAIVSLNGNGYLFDQDFDIMSYGPGYWGTGTATHVALPDGRFSVVGTGELHGVLRIDGAVQSLTWTSQTPEYWNGFTVGTYGKALTATASGNLLTNDSDVEGNALAVSAVNGQQIVGNSVTLDLASGARVQVNRDGSYLYDEDGAFGALGAGQTTVDSFQYTVSDGHGGTATAQARITVTGVNEAPVAVADSVTTNEDTAVSIAVLANDTDVDAGDTKTLLSATGVQHGSLALSGDNVVYTPDSNYSGADSFTYTMRDAAGVQSSATVNVTVNQVSDTFTLSNLVSNGSFEQSSGGGTSAGSTAITGWTVIGSDVDRVASSGWQPADGSYSLDLNGFHPGGVQQVLQTIPGVAYTVGFDLSKNPGNTDHATVQVSGPGNSQSYTFSAANSAGNMLWSQQTFSFTATGTSSTLSFASTYPNDSTGGFPVNARGPALDEVVVVANQSISNFSKGAGGDVLQLHDLLTSVAAPHDTTAFSGGYLRFVQSGGDTLVQIDTNGGGDSFLTVATLSGVQLLQTDTANFVL